MRYQIGVDAELAGFELEVGGCTKGFQIIDLAVQLCDVAVNDLLAFGHAPCEVTFPMCAGNDLQAGVFTVGVIDGEPGGNRSGRRERPIGSILVKRNRLWVVGGLAKDMEGPADNIGTDNIFNDIEDSIVCYNVIQAGTTGVIAEESVAVGLAFGFEKFKQMIDIGAGRAYGFTCRGRERVAIAALIVGIGLGSGKDPDLVTVDLLEV